MINLNYLKNIVKILKLIFLVIHHKEFKKNIKNKIIVKNLKDLKDILNEIFLDIKEKKLEKNIILFSPAGASFDSFKNFEDRGLYFNQLIKKFINAK